MAKTKLDPETRARWAREEEEFRLHVEARAELWRAKREGEARRKARLRRLTFGLLGRG
jgi:hypothetical protein